MSIDFQEIRHRFPLVAYCQERGIRLKRAGNSWIGRCPIHDERKGQAFVVDPQNKRWTCFGKCGRHGDVIDLECALGGGTVKEAVARLTGESEPMALPRREAPAPNPQRSSWNWSPALRFGSQEELRQLAGTRNLSIAACQLAQDRGLLRFVEHREGIAWVVTDQIRENAVARLLNGNPWANGSKAKCLPDTRAKRPIGILESMSFPEIAVVEGAPDMLAVFHFILQSEAQDIIAPICMASANAAFEKGDLRRLQGKLFYLFPHADQAGRAAELRWITTLRPIALDVNSADFTGLITSKGAAVKDLNDLTSVAHNEHIRVEHIRVFERSTEHAADIPPPLPKAG